MNGYKIKFYDGMGGKPEYSQITFPSAQMAIEAANAACARCGDDLAYEIVDAQTHRAVNVAGAA